MSRSTGGGKIVEQTLAVTRTHRSALKGHRPCIVWFTGLPASGKSTLANALDTALNARGVHTVLLDGDNLRLGLNCDLGFSPQDRAENIRRVGEVARLMADAGLIVLCAFVSPQATQRAIVRALVGAGEFFEVHVDTPLEECRRRDPKGLYARAAAGQIADLTGVGQGYEPPPAPEFVAGRRGESAAESARAILDALYRRGVLV